MARKSKAEKKKKEMPPLVIGKVAKALKESVDFRIHLNSGNVQIVSGEAVRPNFEHYKANCRRITAHPSGVVVFQAKE